MAKNFPFFKFIATQWLTGDIVFESFSVQGLFINICAIYWQRDGNLSLEDIEKRYKNAPELSELSGRFFTVSEDKIYIKFLDEQLEDINHISKQNAKNGSLGGRPKASKTLDKKPPAKRNEANENRNKANKNKKENKKENNIIDEHLIFRKFKHLVLTFEENDKLLDFGFSQQQINSTLDNIENYKKNTNYTSLYLTAKKWLEKDKETIKQSPILHNLNQGSRILEKLNSIKPEK